MHRIIALPLLLLFPFYLCFTQPVVLIKHSENPERIKREVLQHLDHLDVTENIHLTVRFTRNIPHGLRGMTYCPDTRQPDGYRHIVIRINNGLTPIYQRLVLAHEMIHVRQYARGELVMINKHLLSWKGKKYRIGAYDRQAPWETEAYKMERILAKKVKAAEKRELPLTQLALRH